MGFFNGTITTSASEQNLFDVTADRHFDTKLFLHNMTANETFVIKVYVLDTNTSTMRLIENETLTGEQNPPAVHIAFLPAKQYKVTIQRTAGTDKAVTWERTEIVIA